MAAGLFHRHARDQRAADDEQTQTLTDDARAADARAATQERKAQAEDARATTAPTYAQRVVAAAKERAAARRAEHERTTADAERTQVLEPHPRVKAAKPVPAGGAVAPIPAESAVDRAEFDRVKARADQAEADKAAAEEKAASRRWARTSFSATISLILGTCAVLAAFSGLLAPVAIVVGVIGLLFAAGGFAAVSRKHVTGHHVVLLGLVFCLAGIVLGVLALNRTLPWLNVDHDQVGQFRDWLNTQWASVRH